MTTVSGHSLVWKESEKIIVLDSLLSMGKRLYAWSGYSNKYMYKRGFTALHSRHMINTCIV